MITILNAATVGVVMLLSASGNASVLSFFGMSVGASVAVMNYIAGIFTPIESLGMEIQTVQSALAGAKRVDEFLNLPERNIPDETKRHIFGYVEQTFRPVPGTVLDQLTLGDPAVTKEMAIRAAKTVGLSETIEFFPDGCDTPYRDEIFSQGERQLLSVARAILDEMTADRDADTERMVLEAIRAASEGRTVLSISHRVYTSLGGKMIHI